MAAYATFNDLVIAFEGTVPDTDQPRLEALLRRASRRLDRIVPSTAYRLASGSLDPDLPAGLVIEAVLRVYRNPEGVTDDTMGPFSKQFNPRSVNAEITFDSTEVHQILDPVMPIPSSFRVGMPTPQQVLDQVSGLSLINQQQVVTVLGSPTGGTFTLGLGGRITTALAFSATGPQVGQALNTAGAGLFEVNVTGAAGGPWTVTFADVQFTTIPLLEAFSSLTGGTSPSITVSMPLLPTGWGPFQ